MKYFNILNCNGNLSSCCTDYGIAQVLSIIKNVVQLLQLFVPIILITMAIFQLIKMTSNPDNKKNMKQLTNKFIAAILVFFIPTIINAVLLILPNQFKITACWNAAEDVEKIIQVSETTYIRPNNKKSTNILTDPGNYEKGEKKENSNSAGTLKGATYLSGGMSIPIYYQGDYKDVSLKSGTDRTVATSGCGFTSCSMIVSYLKNQKITPREFVGDWSKKYYIYGVGMDYGLPQAAATHYGLGTIEQTTSSSKMIAALKNNQPVMSSQSAGLFTSGGHLIVLRGITSDGKILVNDPNRTNAIDRGYNTRKFTVSEIDNTNKMYFIFPAKK